MSKEETFWSQRSEVENLRILAKIARIRKNTGINVEDFLELHFPDSQTAEAGRSHVSE